MAGRFRENWRVPAAMFFSAALISGAYALASGFGSPRVAQASTETALLQQIAARDSTGDGLPDWQKSLYGIPLTATTTDYFHLGMTDGQAVAQGLIVPKAIADVPASSTPSDAAATFGLTAPAEGSLTDTFSKTFFSLYLQAKSANGGVELTADEANTVAQEALDQLAQVVPTNDFKTASDIKVSGTGNDALRAFAESAEAVVKKNQTNATMSEIDYFQSAVQGSDTSALNHLAALSSAYQAMAIGLATLPAPQELAAVDLVIVNQTMRLSEIDNDFARVTSDPLTAMLALEQYPQTELAAEQAFTTLAGIYAASGVVLPSGTPGASFVNLIANIGARQRASAQKP